MKRYIYLTSLSVLFTLLSAWLVSFGFDQRRVYWGKYKYEETDSNALSRLPNVLYAAGEYAWRELDAAGAVGLFRQVVARDPLHMDAWLKLAEEQIAVGNEENARKIAVFCHSYISQILRWKQSHTLLAHDLGLQDIFRYNLNFLVDREKWLADTFYLLDVHTEFQTDQALELLTSGNRAAYLAWLMRWKRSDAASATWTEIEEDGDVTDDLLLDYVHFLVTQKHVKQAIQLWQNHTGLQGMTNAGFETKILNSGFSWRMHEPKDKKKWQRRRVYGLSHEGGHSLRVSFYGKENLKWHHIYQVVPVTPEQPHELTYWWKRKGISTDQGPYVEIYSYDVKGLYEKGPMGLGSCDWVPVTIRFTPPMSCHAVVVRLRRNTSHRFDNKIQGVFWVDGFSMTAQRAVIINDS